MKIGLLLGGAKYINLNHLELQKVWWDARDEYNVDYSVLLIRIAEHSPGAFNRNSIFLRKLFYQVGMQHRFQQSTFYYAIRHKWNTNLCSAQFKALAKTAPELKEVTFTNYIKQNNLTAQLKL